MIAPSNRKVDILRNNLFVGAVFYIEMYLPHKTSFCPATLLTSMYQASTLSGYVSVPSLSLSVILPLGFGTVPTM